MRFRSPRLRRLQQRQRRPRRKDCGEVVCRSAAGYAGRAAPERLAKRVSPQAARIQMFQDGGRGLMKLVQ